MTTRFPSLAGILPSLKPAATAVITGNSLHPLLSGTVSFYTIPMGGVLIFAELFHLPDSNNTGNSGFFAMHIHEFGNCELPFDKTGSHYNPTDSPHPYHAGDLPPLLSDNGYAWMAFYTARFSVQDIIGRSVIIHNNRDDFTTQPSGDAGEKIGCGVIKKY